MARALVLPQPGDVAVETVTSALNEHGLCVIRSFDLKQAMGKDEAGWAPAGRAPCICQYVVLLAYGGGTGPLVVTAWSDDHATRFRVLPAIDPTPYAEVTDLFVAEGARRQGIGTALLRQCEELARSRGAGNLVLLTGRENREAKAFYKSLGYEDYALALRKSLKR